MKKILFLSLLIVFCFSTYSFAKKKNKKSTSPILDCFKKEKYCKKLLDQSKVEKVFLSCMPMAQKQPNKEAMFDFLNLCAIQTEAPFQRTTIPADPCSVKKIGDATCCEVLSGTFEYLCSETYRKWQLKSEQAKQQQNNSTMKK